MDERRQDMINLRETVIRMDENLKHISEWTKSHDCSHKTIYNEIDAIKTRVARWGGGVAVTALLVTWGLKFWK